MPRVLADENVHLDIVFKLIEYGHDVVTVAEAGLGGCDDRRVHRPPSD